MLTGLAPLLSEVLPLYGVTTPLRLAHFLAQAAHETDGFKTLAGYGGTDYFNKRYGPQTSAGKTLGNTRPGDGARFRGRGIFQCTGRFNYAKHGKLIGVDLIGLKERKAYLAKARTIFSGGFSVAAKAPAPMPTPDLPDAPIATEAPSWILKSETVLGAGASVVGSVGAGLLAAIQNPYAVIAFLVVVAAAAFLVWRAMKRRGIV